MEHGYENTVEPDTHLVVHALLCRFFLAFDERDWPAMLACLCPEVRVDYSSSGREAPAVMAAQDFVAARQRQKDTLLKQHNFSNLAVRRVNDALEARCNYQIFRFQPPEDGEATLHSFGRYHFRLQQDAGQWRIAGITQHLKRSVGDRALHAGSRRANR